MERFHAPKVHQRARAVEPGLLSMGMHGFSDAASHRNKGESSSNSYATHDPTGERRERLEIGRAETVKESSWVIMPLRHG
jgi:hypothetical protein